MRAIVLEVDEIYVPSDRRKEMDAERVDAVAEALLEETDENPIQVRKGKDRYVLVKGINRLEACKALGETTIKAFVVAARRH